MPEYILLYVIYCFVSDEFGQLTALTKLWFNNNNKGENKPWQEEKESHQSQS